MSLVVRSNETNHTARPVNLNRIENNKKELFYFGRGGLAGGEKGMPLFLFGGTTLAVLSANVLFVFKGSDNEKTRNAIQSIQAIEASF